MGYIIMLPASISSTKLLDSLTYDPLYSRPHLDEDYMMSWEMVSPPPEMV